MSHTARVTLTVQMAHDCSAWGEDCTLGQIRKQAIESAEREALKLIALAKKEGVRLQIRLDQSTLQINLPPEDRR